MLHGLFAPQKRKKRRLNQVDESIVPRIHDASRVLRENQEAEEEKGNASRGDDAPGLERPNQQAEEVLRANQEAEEKKQKQEDFMDGASIIVPIATYTATWSTSTTTSY